MEIEELKKEVNLLFATYERYKLGLCTYDKALEDGAKIIEKIIKDEKK